jgi:hypothetical protein
VIIAEIGLDMSRFPDADQLVSWAGVCPGNNQSAGKRFSGRMRKDNRYLRHVLTQSAWSIVHKKECFLTSLFWRVAARMPSLGARSCEAFADPSKLYECQTLRIVRVDDVAYHEGDSGKSLLPV